MRIAGCQFGPGIADADDGSALEKVFGESLVLHPAAIDESHLVGLSEPVPASELLHALKYTSIVPFHVQLVAVVDIDEDIHIGRLPAIFVGGAVPLHEFL